jgi:hypothetical protein
LLAIFLSTTAVAQPWVMAFIGVSIARSWTSEVILGQHVVGAKATAQA